jgi:hypothetical protein
MPNLVIVDGPIIRAGESLSEIANFTQGRPVRIVTPKGWDGGDITFQVSVDGVHFDDLFNPDGSEVALVCNGLGRAISLTGQSAIAVSYVKYRAGSSMWPVPQTEDRLLLTVLDGGVNLT